MSLKLINQGKNTVLAENVLLADTFFKRLKGLLGKKALVLGAALMIKPCNSVHTFFMRFAIDVIFLSRDNRVVKTLPNLKPFRFSPLCLEAKAVIELPAGTILSSQTSIGDILILQ